MVVEMKGTKSTGIDGISMKLIKQYFPYIETAMLKLVNQSILLKRFPQSLKRSKIVPILKQGKNSGECGSYRPINLLPSLSNIIEKSVFSQLVRHLDERKILPHNLHGSRAGHSTATALLDIQDRILDQAEQGRTTAILALDNSSAYDVVEHRILLNKLKLIGLDDEAINWMESYLGGRSQQVDVEGFRSPPLMHPPCSVIQGSIGSCLLYAIYTADLPLVLHSAHPRHSPED